MALMPLSAPAKTGYPMPVRRKRSSLCLVLAWAVLRSIQPSGCSAQAVAVQAGALARPAAISGAVGISAAGFSSMGTVGAPLQGLAPASSLGLGPVLAPVASLTPNSPAAALPEQSARPAAPALPAAPIGTAPQTAYSPAAATSDPGTAKAPLPATEARPAEPGIRGELRQLDAELEKKESGRQERSPSAKLGRFWDNSRAAPADRTTPLASDAPSLSRSLESIKELKVGTLNALSLLTRPAEHRWDPDKRALVESRPEEQKSEEHRRQIAAVLQDNDLDVMVLNEVESPQALEAFNRDYLGGAYRTFTLPGNDRFGITTGFLVKKDIPIEVEARTFKDESYFDTAQHRRRRVFTRDLPALVLRPAGDSRPLLVVLGTHMKSKRMNNPGQSGDNMDIRKVQADATASIIARFQAEFGRDVPMLLAGDFNGEPEDPTFADFFRRTRFVDGFDALPKRLSLQERMTHLWFPEGGGVVPRQLDAIFVSPSLRALVKGVRTGRFRDASGKPLPVPSTYADRLKDPSDHYPVLLTLDFQPVVRMQRESSAPRPQAAARAARGHERSGRNARRRSHRR